MLVSIRPPLQGLLRKADVKGVEAHLVGDRNCVHVTGPLAGQCPSKLLSQ